MFQLLLVFIFLNSSLMVWHSFSSSLTRSLTSSMSDSLLILDVGMTEFGSWELSRLSDTNSQPEIDVRRRSCSKNNTCTITLSGSLSFCAACVLASNDSFWQFISRHICSLSESVSHGCACCNNTSSLIHCSNLRTIERCRDSTYTKFYTNVSISFLYIFSNQWKSKISKSVLSNLKRNVENSKIYLEIYVDGAINAISNRPSIVRNGSSKRKELGELQVNIWCNFSKVSIHQVSNHG